MQRTLALVAMGLISLPALADRMPIPADAPPAFKAECGSCHLAFPPALLAANDWRHVMGNLDKHYGDNATLDEKTRRPIEDFLIRNAGSGRRTMGAGVPPRLTFTDWFRHKHDEVTAAVWKDKRVGSAANCTACHTRAETGSFSEREIRMPGEYRHEHD
jgi:nitrate/TMAO reductase-like tetraheme cytochrome c subunit